MPFFYIKIMLEILIKVFLGLFVWMVLPRLIYKKRKYKRNTPRHFVHIVCMTVGILMLVYAGIDMIKFLLS
jgi:hypothetical protein